MSYSGENYIKKLNEEEDARLAKVRLVSDCCNAEVEVCVVPGYSDNPPYPYYVCQECERKCDALTVDLNEEEQ